MLTFANSLIEHEPILARVIASTVTSGLTLADRLALVAMDFLPSSLRSGTRLMFTRSSVPCSTVQDASFQTSDDDARKAVMEVMRCIDRFRISLHVCTLNIERHLTPATCVRSYKVGNEVIPLSKNEVMTRFARFNSC